jgi:hypothetical protein
MQEGGAPDSGIYHSRDYAQCRWCSDTSSKSWVFGVAPEANAKTAADFVFAIDTLCHVVLPDIKIIG